MKLPTDKRGQAIVATQAAVAAAALYALVPGSFEGVLPVGAQLATDLAAFMHVLSKPVIAAAETGLLILLLMPRESTRTSWLFFCDCQLALGIGAVTPLGLLAATLLVAMTFWVIYFLMFVLLALLALLLLGLLAEG